MSKQLTFASFEKLEKRVSVLIRKITLTTNYKENLTSVFSFLLERIKPAHQMLQFTVKTGLFIQ